MPKGIYLHIPHNGTFKKGCVPWIKGRRLSNTHKRKIALSHVGIGHTEETRAKMRIAQKLRFQKTPAWNKGRKMSLEAIENNRKAQTGKKQSIETRRKRSLCLKGEKNHNYIDGRCSRFRKHYADMRYKLWREAVFKRDNYTCQNCFKRGGGDLEPHHLKSYARYPELRYEVDNGQTLCKKCHKLTDNYAGKKEKINPSL